MEKSWFFLPLRLGLFVFSICGVQTILFKKQDTFCKCEDFSIEGKPFVSLWNAPTGGCSKNFSIPIELEDFKILANPHQTWNGKYVVVFYNAQLGYYPYFTNSEGTNTYNGGMPQLIDISTHLGKSREDILRRIPDPNFNGLAVIDWEGWRPIWNRNWGSKKIYQTRSIEIMRSKYPNWSIEQLVEQARNQFETNARRMMQETLKLGKFLRPKAKWGFYGFPDCYGHEDTDYMCSDKHKHFNDRLQWMFSESTALFPSIYLPEKSPTSEVFVRGRILETLRLASKNGASVPIFPYFRLIYEKNPLDYDFLTNEDLMNTIGQAADLGAAGIVMWGNRRDENTSPEVCRQLNAYIHKTLGPYFKNIELQSEKCSEKQCGGKGRCIKENVAKRFQIYKNDIGRKSCPGNPKQFSIQNRKLENKGNGKSQETPENDSQGHEVKSSNAKSLKFVNSLHDKVKDLTAQRTASVTKQQNRKSNVGLRNDTKGSKSNMSNTKYQSKESMNGFFALKSGKMDTMPFLDVDGEEHKKKNRTSSARSETPDKPTDIPSETIYCNKTDSGTTKCMLVKRHQSMKLSKHNNFHIPKIYAVLISISLGGAFMLSTVYIGTYYYFNIFKKQRQV